MATRFVIAEATPIAVALLRYLIAVVCIVPLLRATRPFQIARRDLLPIALLGIAQFGILVVLLNAGAALLPASRTALLFATMPLLTMVVAALAGQETLTLPKTAGVALTIIGVAVTLGDKLLASGGDASSTWLGAFLVLGSALCGAVCSVFYRPYVQRYPVLQVSAVAMAASVGFLALLAAREGFFAALPRYSAAGWAAILFIGVGSALGYWCWLWALNHETPTRVTIFQALSPITALLLGAVVLHEAVPPAAWIGVACVLLGLGVATHRSRARITAHVRLHQSVD